MLELIFWALVFLTIYSYFGYACIAIFISIFTNNIVKKADIYPTVTLLITAYNEQKHIARKIENSLSLDYPKDKLEIIVASDGSTDATESIVSTFADRGVHLIRVEGRVGKTECQNLAVKQARGDILVFSDATTRYDRNAIQKLVRNYNDPTVGAVTGAFKYQLPKDSQFGLGNVLYWEYEKFLKKLQTRIRTLTGASGCIYSVRRALYQSLPPDIISDLVEPLAIVAKGYRVVFEPEALAYEDTTVKYGHEFEMRIRVISRGMHGFLFMRKLLNPAKYGIVSFQIFSHKILRWFAPFFLILIFMLNIFLIEKSIFQICLAVQILFYLSAFIGYLMNRKNKKSKTFTIPFYFCLINIAALIAFLRVLFGHKTIKWEPIRN
jgi:cellulose synthase/poly-beta-1,6-N-acetylglucosamine synthase-like glycosyltransferase